MVVFAGALGAVLTLHAVRSAESTEPVLMLTRDVAAGSRISASDLSRTNVHVDDSVKASLFDGSASSALVGQIAVDGLRRGDLVRRSDVRHSATPQRTRALSFSLPAGDAVNGALHVGDRVDVIGVKRDGSQADYLIANASLVAIDAGRASGPLRSTSANVTITVAVDAEGALRLVAAQAAGRIVVVNATGAEPMFVGERPAVS